MNKNRIITLVVAISIPLIVIVVLLLSGDNEIDEAIEVKSGYTDNYVPVIKKPEPIAPPPPPAVEQKPIIEYVYKSKEPDIEELRRRENFKRSLQTTPHNKLERDTNKYTTTQTQETNTTEAEKAKKVNYAKDFGLEKNDAQNPVYLDRTITADKFIPIILKTAVNSEIPGGVVGMVEENIYSSHSANLLIPKGSTVIGSYQSLSKGGETRLPVVWTRILTPDGININLTSSASADIIGRSGAMGEVDNRLFEKYGIALTLSTVSSVLSYLAFQGTSNATTPEAQLNNNLITNYKNDIGQITAQIMQENMKLAPIVKLHIGQRLLIKSDFDLWFDKIDDRNFRLLIKGAK